MSILRKAAGAATAATAGRRCASTDFMDGSCAAKYLRCCGVRRNDAAIISLAEPGHQRSRGEVHEAYIDSCNDGRACGLRDEAAATPGDADLRERHADPRGSAVPAAASTASTAASGDLPGWHDTSGGLDLPGSPASAAASAARRRTRLTANSARVQTNSRLA